MGKKNQKSSVLICIPTYKEKENINKLIPAILSVFNREGIQGHVLIVDDNSPDGTQDVVREHAKQNPQVILLPRERKQGLGTAYRAGFRRALQTNATIIFEMDADFSHDPNIIPVMVKKISQENKDFVVGSRKVRGGQIVGWGIYRHLVSTGANMFTRLILRLETRDCTSGFRAIKREVLERIDFDRIDTEGYAFQIELLFICERFFGTEIAEVPIVFRDRVIGRSKLGSGDIKEFFFQVFRLLLRGTSKKYRQRVIKRG
ncbi:MAG: polyprenol monophosphomannose synthase [Candidatus Hodarchaeales archaeon]|jgi:dolichol-phosphate mannosyltransferase